MDQGDRNGRALFRARYVLTSLGVETRFTARGDALRGKLDLSSHGPVTNPVTGEPIKHLNFTVEGDGSLRVDDPPALRGTRTEIGDLLSLERLVEQLGASLAKRVSQVSALCERLQRMGLHTSIDGERVTGITRLVMAPQGTATLEIDEHGLVARYLVPSTGDKARLPLGELPIDIEQLNQRSDLERLLAEPVARAFEQRPRRSTAEAEIVLETPVAGSSAAPTPRARSGQPPTLQELVTRFGTGAFPKPGFTIGRPLLVDGQEIRFIANHTQGHAFEVQLRGKEEVLWQGQLELEGMGSLTEWLPQVLDGSPSVEVLDDEPVTEPRALENRLVGGLLPPAVNESWVSDVRVEEDDGVEVRYRGLNVGGVTFGAPRVLPKSAFATSYLPYDGGHRMRVKVVAVHDTTVAYQRVDEAGVPVGSPKESGLIVFLSNFVAESAAS